MEKNIRIKMERLRDEKVDDYVVKTIKTVFSANRYAVYIYHKDNHNDSNPDYQLTLSARTKEDLIKQVKYYLEKVQPKKEDNNQVIIEEVEEYDLDNERITEG